ncbi:MAG: DUF4143 domain-containing protein, partial [Spirochaeta sp.]|nr:DUF4143 domain-containing protein [Spirochaeta sp.]
SEEVGRLWVRGGFPESYLSPDDERSVRWRNDFITTYLERDIPQFGTNLSSNVVRRLWTMLAHNQGGLFKSAQLARSLGIDVRTVNRYVDLLENLLLLRRISPWHANIGKRLVKSPKIYIRDSGLVHALLGITSYDQLLSHPVAGLSWEGFVVEQILAMGAATGAFTDWYFYRTAAGAELDLLLLRSDGTRVAVEVKRSLSPKLGKGFWSAWHDVAPSESYVVYPGTERYPLARGVTALPVAELPMLCGLDP